VVAPVPPFATGSVPVTPLDKGKPVVLVRVPELGVPRAGVTKVGEVAKTRAPDPVSSVTAAARFEEDGVPKNVATFVPKPETPVLIGRPVALVRVAEDGVPSAGVTRVGDVERTLLPDPVLLTETTFLLASSASAVDALSAVRVGVPATLTAPENV
jgi:hypothetical protein